MNIACRMRPQSLEEFVGQPHLIEKGAVIRRMIESGSLFSCIFWGPPGSGKTTLAYLIAHQTKTDFHALSGVSAGKDDLTRVVSTAQENQRIGTRTILFIDEIHRWNKAQQDRLLPHVENGLIILIGATTEKPSFEIISALLSRCKVFVLQGLSQNELAILADKALRDTKRGLGSYKKSIEKDAKELAIRLSGGDGRVLLNSLEIAVVQYSQKVISTVTIQDVFQTKSAGLYDKTGEEHYNLISAFIKSMRASDVDAALYYLVRMLESGEDPKFVARRMIIFASEDIGLADRGALIQANACFEAVHKIGMPEAQLILSHISIYLAKAPKSRSVPNALSKAKKAVYEFPNEPVPLVLRNAPTKLMKKLGYAKDYTWSEVYVGPSKGGSFLPEKLKKKKFFTP